MGATSTRRAVRIRTCRVILLGSRRSICQVERGHLLSYESSNLTTLSGVLLILLLIVIYLTKAWTRLR
ncbi:hypothetical protein LENED_006369 [Lentinula edodes]|uniref:Uncharacterized protein n=1 Tax=Lentinula edodes TaxID=5353 RepID=A0A1Q3EBG9_LENED|nr:hypothetical protein LENED_006369 [Lentinula edodes]